MWREFISIGGFFEKLIVWVRIDRVVMFTGEKYAVIPKIYHGIFFILTYWYKNMFHIQFYMVTNLYT